LGSPSVNEAKLNQENGKTFTIRATRLSKENIYVKRILLNNQPYSILFITHEDIMAVGGMVFEMTSIPVRKVTAEEDLP